VELCTVQTSSLLPKAIPLSLLCSFLLGSSI